MDKTLVLPEGTSVEERIRNDFPNIHIMTVASEREVFEAIDQNEADFGLRSRMVAYYVIRQEGFFNLRTAGDLSDYDNHLRMGVLKDEEILRDILDLGVATITDSERQEIINKYVFFVIEEPIDYLRVFVIGLTFITVVAIVIFAERRLRKANSARRQVLNQMPTLVWYMNKKDEVGFINQAAKSFFDSERFMALFKQDDIDEDYAPLKAAVIEAFETKQTIHKEIVLPNKTQETKHFMIHL